jgi:2-oxoglutarate ferredoxin oxidoreductase subunit alpha
MTATSGPGISLYSENIGLAIMGEVPLVIVDVQRLGPATGGATTGAEGDIQFVRWVTSGGLPVVVLSPSDVASLFTLTVRAFNVAEILRTPVFLLTSKDLVLSMHTVDTKEIAWPEVVDRNRFTGKGSYVPYRFDEIAAVPDFLPVGAREPVRFTTSMHDEHGYLTKVPANVERKIRHLSDKITEHPEAIESIRVDVEEGARDLLIAYGLNAALCREVLREVRRQGKKCSLLIIESLFPVPEAAIARSLQGIERVVLPEMNLGLYAAAVERFIPPTVELRSVQRVDGELLSVEEVISRGNLL